MRDVGWIVGAQSIMGEVWVGPLQPSGSKLTPTHLTHFENLKRESSQYCCSAESAVWLLSRAALRQECYNGAVPGATGDGMLSVQQPPPPPPPTYLPQTRGYYMEISV